MLGVLLLIACSVLPSVLGGCCFPDTMSGVMYTGGMEHGSTVTADFTQKKYIIRPSAGPVRYRLNDVRKMIAYTRFQDNSCTYEDITIPLYQCTPKEATQLPTVTFAGQRVDSYHVALNKMDSETTMVTESCIPVVFVRKQGDYVSTSVFVNVISPVDDVSDLDQNVDDCTL